MGRIAGQSPEDTRRKVIDGAADAFAELGYEGARIGDIAKAAGMSHGAMYSHFSSKAELLAAVVERHACTSLLAWLDARNSAGLLDLILDHALELGNGQGADAALLIEAIAAARRDPDVLAALSRQVGDQESLLAQLIALAQGNGDFTGDLPADATARFVLMVILGSVLVDAMHLPDLDDQDWAKFATTLVGGFRTEASER